MAQEDLNRNPILPSLTEDEQFMSAEAFSSANSAYDWDSLVSRGGCSNNPQQTSVKSRWERDSLYVKFDPLLNSQNADGGGMGAPGGSAVNDRLSSVFKVPNLPGKLPPPLGAANGNVYSPVSDSGSSYKSANDESASHEVLDDELFIPPTNGSLHNCPSPPRHDLQQLGKGDAESSLNTTDFELAAEFLNQEKEIFNETVILTMPIFLEDDKVNGNDIVCGESSPPPPSAPPAPTLRVTDPDGVSAVSHPENEDSQCQNNLLFSPFSVSTPAQRVDSDDVDELNNMFNKTVAISTPVRSCGAVFDIGSGEPVAGADMNDEDLKKRAEVSISDDSFLEAFSRGVCLKTPARPVPADSKSPEGDEKPHHNQYLNETFDMSLPSASESLDVTQIITSTDFDADAVGNGNQNLNLTQPLSQFPVGCDDNNDHHEEQDEEEERLDHTAPIIDTSFSEEDDIPTAPNSVEPFPTEEGPAEQEEQGCQDIIIEDSKLGMESPPPPSPKIEKSLENCSPSPESTIPSESFANSSNPNVISPSKSFTIAENGIESSGDGDSSLSSSSGNNSQAERAPTPSPSSPLPKAYQERLDRIQALKDQIAQSDLEYEEICRESKEEVTMKEGRLKAITTQVEEKTKSVERKEAAVQQATEERDQAIADLKKMEANFAEMLGMYENIKSLQIGMEKNCEALKKREHVLVQALQRREERDNASCQVVDDCLEVMKEEFETRVKEKEAENLKLKARLRMCEMSVEKMEAKMVQLDRESDKLRALCDDLLKADIN
ncbi:unnamed protein product [Orchesella dallaii]|uniref:Transforming acidic coiled-coil-containing protein C-terminal domain-containing protein n=1 Tax=Orchesella dallaii TaxID=48710 RepID=A0ABP1S0S0_9HEXA